MFLLRDLTQSGKHGDTGMYSEKCKYRHVVKTRHVIVKANTARMEISFESSILYYIDIIKCIL